MEIVNVMWEYCNGCGKENKFYRKKRFCSDRCERMTIGTISGYISDYTSNIHIDKSLRLLNNAIKIIRKEQWRLLREQVFRVYGKICLKCGSKENIQVDHIKPKSKYPLLEYSFNNLQPLCWPCNKEKCNRNESDYRHVHSIG